MAQPAEFMSDERSNDIGQIVTRAGERVMRFIRARDWPKPPWCDSGHAEEQGPDAPAQT